MNKFFILCRERETPPRFAQPGTFEFEYSQRWKSLDEMEKQQRDQVEKNMKDAKDKLESEMEDAYHEHQANLLRQGDWQNSFIRASSIVLIWNSCKCI